MVGAQLPIIIYYAIYGLIWIFYCFLLFLLNKHRNEAPFNSMYFKMMKFLGWCQSNNNKSIMNKNKILRIITHSLAGLVDVLQFLHNLLFWRSLENFNAQVWEYNLPVI